MKKLLTVLLVVSLLLSMTAALAGCKKNGGTYTVEVVNGIGTPMVGIDVYIYRDAAKNELVTFAKTDADGKMTFTDNKAAKCFIALGGVPKGYAVEDTYPVTGETTRITLETALRTDFDLATEKIVLGDIMFDFRFTDTDGNEYQLSELLKTKKAVVLNFWYTNCGPCKSEFPFLQQAYEKYADDLTLLAMDPVADDDAVAVAAFKAQNKLNIPMGTCDPNWEKAMQLVGYPTTVVIDRTGMVTFMHTGMITDAATFETIFAYYTADDYVQKATTKVEDLQVEASDEPDGSAAAPFEVGGVLEFDAEVKAGKSVFYHVYKVSGTDLELQSTTANLVYNGTTYQPKDGVITFPVSTDDVNTPITLEIINTGDKDEKYHITFSYPGGTMTNPYALATGEVSVSLKKGNDQGTVYLYKATESGTLTFKVNSVTDNVQYDVSLYNLNTYAMRTLEEDGNADSVSVVVNKGDEVPVTVSALPNDENEYPAATVKATVSFKKGEGTGGQQQATTVTYSVTVKDDSGKAVSGIKFTFAVNGKTATATTNAKGVASVSLPSGDCVATMTLPSGYIAPALEFALNADKRSTAVTLEKEVIDENVGTTPTDYTVKLVDAKGKAVTGVTVQFYLGKTKKGEKKVDSKGVAKINLLDATYTVKLSGTTLKYDEGMAKVTATATSLELLLTDKAQTAVTNAYPKKEAVVKTGAWHVTLTPGKLSYLWFTVEESGTYRFATTNKNVAIGYYGGSFNVLQLPITTGDTVQETNNSLTISFVDAGPTVVIGLLAPTNVSTTVVQITRIGDAKWSPALEPWEEYEGSYTPKPFTYTGGKLTNFDMTSATSAYKLVLGSDGYYHLGSANGQRVYMRLGSKAPYQRSISAVLGLDGGPAGSNFGIYIYDAAGNFVRKERYNDLLGEYVANMDANEGIYPLTPDLMYMIQQAGGYRGWWDPASPDYLFVDDDFEPIPGINNEIGWMYALCY